MEKTDAIRRLLRRSHWSDLSRVLHRAAREAANRPTEGNHLTVFFDGGRLYEQMLKDIQSAKQYIYLEVFWFESDAVGWRFAKTLANQACRGITVKIIIDDVGCFSANPEIFQYLRHHGVEVCTYNPAKGLRLLNRRSLVHPIKIVAILYRILENIYYRTVHKRDHRKILAIDGETGYAGGVNIAQQWVKNGQTPAWKDTHVRLCGPAVKDLAVLFAETWHAETGKMPPFIELGETSSTEASDEPVPAQVYVIKESNRFFKRNISRIYLEAIRAATTTIAITNSYFIPPLIIRQALCAACRRGVKVKLLLPDLCDIKVVQLASQYFFSEMLRHGIEIYLWPNSTLHTKSLVVDDSHTIIGSSNLETFSLFVNLETDVLICDSNISQQILRRFLRDIAVSKKLSPREWRSRPMRQKFLEFFWAQLRWML